jgi:hypothetical protein
MRRSLAGARLGGLRPRLATAGSGGPETARRALRPVVARSFAARASEEMPQPAGDSDAKPARSDPSPPSVPAQAGPTPCGTLRSNVNLMSTWMKLFGRPRNQ